MNILLIHSDQHRYDCVRANGLRENVETPHLDRLAAEGTTFDMAFSTIPICTPARASLMTGAWPTRHGSHCIPTSELNRAARPDLPVLTRLLADAGHRVAWTGKFHGETEETPGPSNGVEEWIGPGSYPVWREQQKIPPLRREGGLFGNVDSDCPPEKSALAWQADQVIRQLEERRNDRFFIRWDPPEPHLPCRPTSPFADRFAEAGIPPWTSFPDTLGGKPATQKRQVRIWDVEDWSWEQWLPVVRLYYAIISEMDHHIGRVLAKLDELGLAADTLVLYSSDHGDFCGGHGQMDKHFNMYDDVVRVPMIMRWPGRIPAGARRDAFVSGSVDIAATILEAAGVEKPDTFAGESLLRMAGDPACQPRKYAFAQYFGTESGAYSMRMIRDRRYKFVYHPVGDLDEFYDLGEDPGELRNLLAPENIEHRKTAAASIARLRKALFKTMREHQDPLANRWTEMELGEVSDRPVK